MILKKITLKCIDYLYQDAIIQMKHNHTEKRKISLYVAVNMQDIAAYLVFFLQHLINNPFFRAIDDICPFARPF